MQPQFRVREIAKYSKLKLRLIFLQPVKQVFIFQAKRVKKTDTREAYQLKIDSHKDFGAASIAFSCYRSKKLPSEWLKLPPFTC